MVNSTRVSFSQPEYIFSNTRHTATRRDRLERCAIATRLLRLSVDAFVGCLLTCLQAPGTLKCFSVKKDSASTRVLVTNNTTKNYCCGAGHAMLAKHAPPPQYPAVLLARVPTFVPPTLLSGGEWDCGVVVVVAADTVGGRCVERTGWFCWFAVQRSATRQSRWKPRYPPMRTHPRRPSWERPRIVPGSSAVWFGFRVAHKGKKKATDTVRKCKKYEPTQTATCNDNQTRRSAALTYRIGPSPALDSTVLLVMWIPSRHQGGIEIIEFDRDASILVVSSSIIILHQVLHERQVRIEHGPSRHVMQVCHSLRHDHGPVESLGQCRTSCYNC